MNYIHGIRQNLGLFAQQLLQVFFVGLTIGMQRTVIPVLAESEFGVPADSAVLLMAFVISFGFVKNILLGVNQGFTWSMTVTSKLDIIRPEQRGLATGFNEFSGYGGVALAGVITGYLAVDFDPRQSLFAFGLVVILLALVSALLFSRETIHWARAESAAHKAGTHDGPPDICGTVAGRVRREIRRCTRLGVLPGVSVLERPDARANRLGRWNLRFRLGWQSALDRAVVGRVRPQVADCDRHVDVCNWRRGDTDGRRHACLVVYGCSDWSGDGAAVPHTYCGSR